VDNLLLGWVWLQNKEARVAKGYFQTALVQSPQDEARYALGLCYLLLGDISAAQDIVKEMKSGKQKDHLRSLLLR
jgi:thioredoxin-like negative regulator of GroEL